MISQIAFILMGHPLGTKNDCTKSNENSSSSCRDISIWTKAVDQQNDIAILLMTKNNNRK